ncbi:10210_t:CDS:2 [Gigaspora margarita]|uniref:10210_t:CDS:1 n=1 Tax=Gigaspora margarita TaxID=4874 RepID=A0ABN7UI72_GIGMA|nr:10210_t:CDS:2 [Gigaspora margarita]
MLSLPKKNTTIEIIFEDDNCIMYGLPEESDGCKLKGKVLLTSSKGLKIKNFNFAFIGKTSITCCPFISSTRPECNESHTVCKRECSFPSPPRIPPGIHEFKFEVDLPGHLPSSFKGTRGKIEYWCYVVIERPLFHADISIKKSVTIQRSLLPNDIVTSPITLQDRLSTFTDGILDEKVQYHINAPIMAYREGGDYHRRLSFSDAPSQIIHNSNSNSNFHRFSHNDVNFHQSRSMPGSFVNHQILNSIPHNCAESVPNNSITKKTFAHKEQLSLEIPLIVTTKSRSNNPSNFQDNERSPPYTMVEDPPAYMYAALVPPPPRYNRDS